MSYQAWSVVFGEQPSASKWNILGQNDASFNDGTGIADNAIIARHILADTISMYTKTLASGCGLRKSTGQTLANETITAITWDTEEFDTDGYHSTSSNTSRITVPKAGKYLITASLSYASNATGARFLWFQKNGVTGRTGLNGGNAPTSNDNGVTSSVIMSLAANDYIEAIGFQSSGGNLSVQGENGQIGYSTFCIARLGA